MLTCRQIADFLMDFLDGSLPWRQRTIFRIHLWMCPPCRRYLAQYEETVDLGRDACDGDEAGTADDAPEELVKAILRARK